MADLHDLVASAREAVLSLSTLTLCIYLSLLAALSYFVYIRFFSALAGIPGPSSAIFSRLWLAYHSQKGDMHIVVPKLHEKYGKLVRLAPNEVSVADLNAIKEIYGMFFCSVWIDTRYAFCSRRNIGPGSKFRKSDWYSTFSISSH